MLQHLSKARKHLNNFVVVKNEYNIILVTSYKFCLVEFKNNS